MADARRSSESWRGCAQLRALVPRNDPGGQAALAHVAEFVRCHPPSDGETLGATLERAGTTLPPGALHDALVRLRRLLEDTVRREPEP